MRSLRPILLMAFLSFPMLCRAEESCLWLNAATAGGFLGGEVTATVSPGNAHTPKVQTANAKSGAGPLSANPSVTGYAGNGMDDSDCFFVRQPPSAGALRIEVRTMSKPAKEFASYTARCGPHAVPLQAIGNEAFTCETKEKSGRIAEQVVGRVRERSFVVRLSMGGGSISQTLLREKAEKVAEIVSGNLF
jgi:hypothetical protein